MERFNSRVYEAAIQPSARSVLLRIAAVLSFLEASVWFVFPDYWLVPLCLLGPKSYKRMLMIIWLSSVAGTVAYIILVSSQPALTRTWLSRTPFITGAMIEKVFVLGEQADVGQLARQPFSGIPIKAWTVGYISQGFTPLVFVIVTALARLVRMVVVAWVSASVARNARGNQIVSRHFATVMLLYTVWFFTSLIITSQRAA